MANPSLQIGNSNWAIKEDNLLGYSTAGTRFVPQPITMTRASAGTRVNPQGLVETVELLGSELVEDGGFSSSADWGTTLGWSIADNKASNDGTGGILRQTNTVPLNTRFKVVFTVADYVTGNIQIKFAPIAQTIVITGDATYTIYTDGNNSVNGDLQIIATSSFQGSITNISVKEYTKNNLARVDYDGTASSLLVEPERTNLVPYSEDFSSWTTVSATLTPNQLSPDGTNNAYIVEDDNASGSGYEKVDVTITTTATPCTLSVFIKKKTSSVSAYSGIQMGTGFSYLIFDSYNGTYNQSSNTNYDSIEVENFNSDWWRLKLTATVTTSTRVALWGAISSNGTTISPSATGSETFWGTQLEQGSYATSYIPNFGTALGVTRVQDIFTRDGIGSLINSTEGVLFVELSKPVINAGTHSLISLNNNASNSDANGVVIGFDNDGSFFIRLKSAGTTIFQDNSTSSVVNTFYKVAISYKSGVSLIYIDGSPITPSSGSLSNSFTFAATLDNLSFDYNGNNGLPFYGKVKQLQVFKTALTPTELIALTT